MVDRIVFLLHLVKEAKRVYGRTKLQKLVYLCSQKHNEVPYVFEWYRYGPFSRTLSTDLTDLVRQGMIKEECEGVSLDDGSISERYVYEISEAGLEYIDQLALEASIQQTISEIVRQYGFMPRKELIELVYGEAEIVRK